MKIFVPKLIYTLKNYSRRQFFADLMAGVIVGIVALPLAIAFGIASGVPPEKGLITAIIAGFIVSFLGGSRVQIGGPTGAFIIIVYGIIQQFGFNGLLIATIMAGIMLLLMGVCRLGTVIKFIPYPVVVGFTSGIALTILTTQMKDFFGLQIENIPGDFLHKWLVYFQNIGTANWWSIFLGLLSILLIIFTPKINKKIPGSLVAILVVSVLAYFLKNHFAITSITTIGDIFSINPSLPQPETPKIDFNAVQMLLPTAFTIAILGAIESLLSATVADGAIGSRHNSNTELIAQGIANIVTPIFGGIPATGAIARTMTNINNGGRTPVAGIIHAVVLLLILLFLGNLTKHIPMASLAAVLIVVSYNMSQWRMFRSMLRGAKSDVAVLITTFLLTVIFDLTIAIEVGMLLAIVLFIKRISESSQISLIRGATHKAEYIEGNVDTDLLQLPHNVEVYEIEGPFFFGLANKFEETMKQIGDKPKVRIIRMRKVPFIDSTGIHNLEILIRSSQREKISVLLSGVNPKVKQELLSANIDKLVGLENICPHIDAAMEKAKALVT
ncbi:MAG: sulfate permease [Prevotellaceae bacterium]|jgi:SulP family sulfate permease|nr:sulfate permease [Prevotellaceae bacterium]